MNAQKISSFWKDPGFYLSFLFMTAVLVELTLCLDFPYRARLFPLIVGFICLALITLDLLGRIFPELAQRLDKLRGGQMLDISKMESERSSGRDSADQESHRFDYLSFLKIFLWFTGYFLLLPFIGYLFSIIIFLFLFLKFFSKCRLTTSIQITAGVALATWTIFSLILDVPWYEGLQ